MSRLLITHYLADLDRLRRVSGSSRESVVREAFKDLLKAWGRSHNLQFIPEHEYITPAKGTVVTSMAPSSTTSVSPSATGKQKTPTTTLMVIAHPGLAVRR